MTSSAIGERPPHSHHVFEDYWLCEETQRDHLVELRAIYNFKIFSGRGARDLKAWLEQEVETARSNEDLARRFVEECRRTQTMLPGGSVIKRLCADALVAAARRIESRIWDFLPKTISRSRTPLPRRLP